MTSIKVFTAQESAAAAQTDASKILTILAKKENKYYQGTRFFDAKWSIGKNFKKDGWFNVEDIMLTSGIAAPGDKENNPSAEFEGTRLQLSTNLEHAGPWGQFLDLLEPEWFKQVEELSGKGVIDLDGKKIHALIQRTYSKKHKTNAGKPLDNPIIRFKMDFTKFPARFPIKNLVGTPKTQIFDYRKPYVDGLGRAQYHPATITNDNGEEEVVDATNVHKFVTRGSVLRKGRIMMHSVSESQGWVSLTPVVTRAIIEGGGDECFDDEEFVGEGGNENTTPEVAIREAFKVPTNSPVEEKEIVETTETVETEPSQINDADIDNMMNDLNGI